MKVAILYFYEGDMDEFHLEGIYATKEAAMRGVPNVCREKWEDVFEEECDPSLSDEEVTEQFFMRAKRLEGCWLCGFTISEREVIE